MKNCAICLLPKTLEEFPLNKSSKDGRYRLCKNCNSTVLKIRNDSASFKSKRKIYLSCNRDRINEQALQSHFRHHEKNKARMLARRNAKKEEYIKKAKEWRSLNPEKVKHNRDKWFKERPGYITERGMRRYAGRCAATPIWANIGAIRCLYAMASVAGEITGIEYNVDHVVPLRGKNVCGFHVENNLKIVSAIINRRKSNLWQST